MTTRNAPAAGSVEASRYSSCCCLPRSAAGHRCPLRLIVGYGFAEHGFAKLSRGPDNFTGILHAMGLPLPHVFAWITIVTEIVGGLCILVGALVPVVSIPMAIVLLVAIFTVQLPYGFPSIKLEAITPNGAHFGQPGYE